MIKRISLADYLAEHSNRNIQDAYEAAIRDSAVYGLGYISLNSNGVVKCVPFEEIKRIKKADKKVKFK